MKPDPKRFSKLLFYMSSGFIGLYLISSIRRLYQNIQYPETVLPDAISPIVDIVVVGAVVLAYLIFLLVRYIRDWEERAFQRHYAAAQRNKHKHGKSTSDAG